MAPSVVFLQSCQKQVNTFSLSGKWSFSLDPGDVGKEQKWYLQELSDIVFLPGSLQEQGNGDKITAETQLSGAEGINDRNSNWKNNPANAQWTQEENIMLPWTWMPERIYVGVAWYQKEIEIPKEWENQSIILTLERAHWHTAVWIDTEKAGTCDYLSAQHIYNLRQLKAGKHTLTIRVDNRLHINPGTWAHSVSFHTQTNWNGIIGDITIHPEPITFINDIQVYPNLSATISEAFIIVSFNQYSDKTYQYKVVTNDTGTLISSGSFTANDTQHEFTANLKNAPLWSEFNPKLCKIIITAGDEKKSQTFGLRNIEYKGTDIFINGKKVFFRGTNDCCIFPLTAYPSMDKESWMKIIKSCQLYGLNHIRFHSWCPPKAAFEAADELGFFLQPESSVWTAIGAGNPVDDWLPLEAASIIKAFGNHPSFVLFSFGNEFTHNYIPLIDNTIIRLKEQGVRQLFASHTGQMFQDNPYNETQTDFFVIGHSNMRGSHGWYGKDYKEGLEKHVPENMPFIVHENGQWCAFPGQDVLKKMTGKLKDSPTEIVKDRLKQNGLFEQWDDFTRLSGEWQKQCYKEEIEAAFRTKGYSGFQLLDLRDFPGQGNALVGILDYFYESKGYAPPEEFTRFCNQVVPLVRLNKKILTQTDNLEVQIEFANYSSDRIPNAEIYWQIKNMRNLVVQEGTIASLNIERGSPLSIDSIIIQCNKLLPAQQYKLVIGISDTPYENDWYFWVFPPSIQLKQGTVNVVHSLSEAYPLLEKGLNVLLMPEKVPVNSPYGSIRPFFWNNYFFGPSENGTLGLMIDKQHEALQNFPTDHFTNYQWNNVMENSRYIDITRINPALSPIIQVVDDWNTCRKLSLMFECKAERGKLMVLTSRIDTIKTDPAAQQLLHSILNYMNSDSFNPEVSLTQNDLDNCLSPVYQSEITKLKNARIVNYDATAKRLINGSPYSFWRSPVSQNLKPDVNRSDICFEIIIDLGETTSFKGMRFIPRQDNLDGIFDRYAVHTSDDMKNWGEITGEVVWWGASNRMPKEMWFNKPINKRYIKIGTGHLHTNYISLGEIDIIK